jgi:beta-lactamase regulating signal transducer with metallopeptidase domain
MLEMFITSSALILAVIALRRLFRGRLSLRVQYGLWALVALRLLVPGALFSSPVSVMSGAEQAAQQLTELRQTAEAGQRPTPSGTEADTISAASGAEEAAPSGDTASAHRDQSGTAASVSTAQGSAGLTGETVSTRSYGWSLADAPWGDIARAVWVCGMCVTALWFLISNEYFRRELRYGSAPVEAPGSPLPVYATGAASPCLCGLFRPVIYVTRDCLGDERKLRHVIAHEVTHYRHGDQIWSLVRCVCLVVWWFHPLVWVAAALSRRDCELACDEGAIRRLGESERAAYGRTLIGAAIQSSDPCSLLRTAATMSGGKRSLTERVTLIAKRPRMTAASLAAALVMAALAAGCAFTGTAAKTAEEPEQTGGAVVCEAYDQVGGAAYAVLEAESALSDSELLGQALDFDVPEAELQIYEVRPTGNQAAIFWYAQQAAQRLTALPDSVSWRPQAAQMKEAWVEQSYFYGDDPNFCGYIQLYIQARDLSDPVWTSAGTMETVQEGEYAGWGVLTMAVTFYYDWDSATYVLYERSSGGSRSSPPRWMRQRWRNCSTICCFSPPAPPWTASPTPFSPGLPRRRCARRWWTSTRTRKRWTGRPEWSAAAWGNS